MKINLKELIQSEPDDEFNQGDELQYSLSKAFTQLSELKKAYKRLQDDHTDKRKLAWWAVVVVTLWLGFVGYTVYTNECKAGLSDIVLRGI